MDGFPPSKFPSITSTLHETHIHSAPYLSSSIVPSDSTLESTSPSSTSLLTPLRKHHKLLKDGSGLEVWPDNVEQIFVQGLRAYFTTTASQHQSVKALDSGAPARSRLRNAFLVSYLAECGIERSRKQVASHLQVLKNMWKVDGNPNYYLVAGSEPLPPSVQTSRSESVSSADHHRHPSPASSCSSSASSSSSSSSSLTMSSPGTWSQSLATVTSAYSSPCSSAQSSPLGRQHSTQTRLVAELSQPFFRRSHHSLPEATDLGASIVTARHSEPKPVGVPTHISTHGQIPSTRRQQQHYHPQLDVLQCASTSSRKFELNAVEPQSLQQQRQKIFYKVSSSPGSTATSDMLLGHAAPIPKKLLLSTEGMHTLIIDIDKLPGEAQITSLRLQLDVPRARTSTASSGMANSQGFSAQVQAYLPASAQTVAACKCLTQTWGIHSAHSSVSSATTHGLDPRVKHESQSDERFLLRRKEEFQVFSRRREDQLPLSCLGEEEGIAETAELPRDQEPLMDAKRLILFTLPNSALSTCRWLEQGATMIHQELSYRGQVILRLTYSLNRMEELPAARLLYWESLSSSPAVPSTQSHASDVHSEYRSPSDTHYHQPQPQSVYNPRPEL